MTNSQPSPSSVKVLAFDTFGTVTDWHTGISGAVTETLGDDLDAGAFTRAWRTRYAPIMGEVEAGERPWQGLDDLQRITVRDTADEFEVAIDDDQVESLVRAWRSIPAWPDAADGLRRLREKYTVVALSNGTVALLTEMSKHNDFGWDFIGGSDLWRHYKPSPATYRGIAYLLEVPTSQVMMVATHQSDLDAARSNGLRTAFIERPDEWGGQPKDDSGSPDNDLHATDVHDLADQLGVARAER